MKYLFNVYDHMADFAYLEFIKKLNNDFETIKLSFGLFLAFSGLSCVILEILAIRKI